MFLSSAEALGAGAAAATSVDDGRAEIHALYRKERASLARHLLALTGDRSTVEDLVNETFIRAFQSLRSFSRQSSMRTWLHGIAINVARNYRAKHRRRLAKPVNISAPPPIDTPEDELNRRQAIARLYQAIEQLEPQLREVFVLRVLEEHSFKDVGEILAIPVSTAHARAARAERLVRTGLALDVESP